jgi:hypothetical protein
MATGSAPVGINPNRRRSSLPTVEMTSVYRANDGVTSIVISTGGELTFGLS